eukprot:TCONS_00013956-protein
MTSTTASQMMKTVSITIALTCLILSTDINAASINRNKIIQHEQCLSVCKTNFLNCGTNLQEQFECMQKRNKCFDVCDGNDDDAKRDVITTGEEESESELDLLRTLYQIKRQ